MLEWEIPPSSRCRSLPSVRCLPSLPMDIRMIELNLSAGQLPQGRKAPRRKEAAAAFPSIREGASRLLPTCYINLCFPPPLPTFFFSSSHSQSINLQYKQTTPPTNQTTQPTSQWRPSRTPPTTFPSLSSRPVLPPPRRPTSRSPRMTTSPLATGKLSTFHLHDDFRLILSSVPPPPRTPLATRSTSPSTTSRARATRSRPSTKSFPRYPNTREFSMGRRLEWIGTRNEAGTPGN